VENSELLNKDMQIKARMDGIFTHQNGRDFPNVTLNTSLQLVEI
jgi:hypothetical protein